MGLQPIRGPKRLDEAVSRVVGATDVPNLPLCHEVVQRPQCLVDSNVSVLHVHLVEVDHVRLQAAKRSLASRHDRLAREAPFVRPRFVRHPEAEGEAAFSCNEQLVPLAGCPLTRQLFAAPFSVDVSGINEVDAGFQSAIKDPPRLFLGGRDPLQVGLRRSECHRAERECAHAQSRSAKSA